MYLSPMSTVILVHWRRDMSNRYVQVPPFRKSSETGQWPQHCADILFNGILCLNRVAYGIISGSTLYVAAPIKSLYRHARWVD